MPSRPFSVVKGEVIRITELDICGNPAGGSYIVSDGFVQVQLANVMESGDEYIQKKANGKLCINRRNPDSRKRINVTIDWCEVCPDIISIITGEPLELDEMMDARGFRLQEKTFDSRFALELWTGLGEEDCDQFANAEYGYLLIPQITGASIMDLTFGNTATTFQTTGYTIGKSRWGVGPFPVFGTPINPLYINEPISDVDHALIRTTNYPPPAASCMAGQVSSSFGESA